MERNEDGATGQSEDQGESHDEDGGGDKSRVRRRSARVEEDVALTFPQRLMEALMDGRYQDILSWDDEREDAFIIHRKGKFTDEILPKFFNKRSKFSSFVRKLTRWGFVRISKGTESAKFIHPLFRRGNYRLLSQLSCNSVNPNPTSAQTAPPRGTTASADTQVTTASQTRQPSSTVAGPVAALPPASDPNPDAARIALLLAASSGSDLLPSPTPENDTTSTQLAAAFQLMQQQQAAQLPLLATTSNNNSDTTQIGTAYQQLLQRKQAQDLELALKTNLLQQQQQQQAQAGQRALAEHGQLLAQLSFERQLRGQLQTQQLQAQIQNLAQHELVRLLGGTANIASPLSLAQQQPAAASTAVPQLASLSNLLGTTANAQTATNQSSTTEETGARTNQTSDDRKPSPRK
mmetsp:Transcript_24955/g.58571  ORF Transcript_24955/g.58571 Transcript_24955/m.58571 type:complete len:406 (-) Transcript_24955:131-1348(-)